MDIEFEKSRLKPGDSGYEWNRVVEFAAPEQMNEWDDEEDD